MKILLKIERVCVIGERTEKELFEEGENPIGAYIRLDNIYFQVVGVHKYTPGGGFESDSDVFIPFFYFQEIIQYSRQCGLAHYSGI